MSETQLQWRAFWIDEPSEIFVAQSYDEALACLRAMVGDSEEYGQEGGELDLDTTLLTDEEGTTHSLRTWIAFERPTEAQQFGSQYV